MARSEEKTDLFGKKYIQHYDDAGREIGRSEARTGIFGDEFTQHTNERGESVGRTEHETGILGGETDQHYAERGEKLGHSEEKKDIFGAEYEQHYDDRGREAGRSEKKTGLFGDKYIEHDNEHRPRPFIRPAPPSRPRSDSDDDDLAGHLIKGILALIAALTIAVITAGAVAIWKYRHVRALFFLCLAVAVQFGLFTTLALQNHFVIAAVAAAALSVLLYRFCFSTWRWRAEQGSRANAWQASGIMAAVTLAAYLVIGLTQPTFITDPIGEIQRRSAPLLRQAEVRPAPAEPPAFDPPSTSSADFYGDSAAVPNESAAAPNGESFGPPDLSSTPFAPNESAGSSRQSPGWLGVSVQTLDPDIADSLGLDSSRGALVVRVAPDGPAARAGIKPGDVVLTFNGSAVADGRDLTQRVGATSPGQRVSLDVVRNGVGETVSAEIGERPAQPAAARNGAEEPSPNSAPPSYAPYDLAQLHPQVRAAVRRARAEESRAIDAASRARQAAQRAEIFAQRARNGEPGTRAATLTRGQSRVRNETEWRDGTRNGYGVQTVVAGPLVGHRYAGEWNGGDLEGVGVVSFAQNPDNTVNLLRYEGEFAGGRQNGAGVTFWRSGEHYAGGLRDSLVNGPGVLYWQNGRRHEGDYANGASNGYGVLWDAEGRVSQQGIWRNRNLTTPLSR